MAIAELATKFREHVEGAKIRVGVAVDGSRVSEKAWHTALHFHALHKGSEVFVLHVTQASKTYLPQHLSATHIQHEYTTAFIKHQLTNAEFHSVECEPKESTCHALTRLAEHLNIDFLFVGSFGRKKGDSATVAGYALLTAVEHLVRPADTIHVLAVQSEHRDGTSPSPDNACQSLTDSDLEEYRKVLEAWGGNATVQRHTLRRGTSVAEGILEVGNAQEVDFIVMGIAGNDDKSIGSVTQSVFKGARCTTFAIKNPFRVFKDHLIGAHSLFDKMVAPGVQRHLVESQLSDAHRGTADQ